MAGSALSIRGAALWSEGGRSEEQTQSWVMRVMGFPRRFIQPNQASCSKGTL